MGMLSRKDIQQQSDRTYKQWAPQWREQAKRNSKWVMKPLSDFEASGVGKAVLCVATGASLEEEIETIKQYQGNVDIICCDKSLGPLLDNGIVPKFCLVCDANVSYEKYLKPWESKLSDITLISNVCANPLWVEKGNWKDRYFFVVMDVLGSEKEFSAISGCRNIVAAGTNVSNSLVILLTQSENHAPRNFFGYDKILLVGFDYCWQIDGHYYAFNADGGGKHNYMRHGFLWNIAGEHVCSSGNLIFSAKWLATYITTFRLPVVQCSRRSILKTPRMGRLSEQMQYSFRPEDGQKLKDGMKLRNVLAERLAKIENELKTTALEHHYAFAGSTVS